MPSEAFENLTAMLSATRVRPDASLAETRAGWDLMEDLLPASAGVDRSDVDISGIPASWFVPPDASSLTFIHFHGGGYVIGSRKSHSAFASHLASAVGGRVLLPEYRLAPEHPAPAAIDDAIAVYEWVLAQGSAAADVVLSGDSAGGGLALATLQVLRDKGAALPAAGVLLSPWTDLTQGGASVTSNAATDIILSPALLEVWGAHYRGSLPADDPRVSPLYGDLAGLPPLLVQVADSELLLDDARRLAEGAEDGSVTLAVWEERFHVWPVLGAGLVPEAQEALTEIAAFAARVR